MAPGWEATLDDLEKLNLTGTFTVRRSLPLTGATELAVERL